MAGNEQHWLQKLQLGRGRLVLQPLRDQYPDTWPYTQTANLLASWGCFSRDWQVHSVLLVLKSATAYSSRIASKFLGNQCSYCPIILKPSKPVRKILEKVNCSFQDCCCMYGSVVWTVLWYLSCHKILAMLMHAAGTQFKHFFHSPGGHHGNLSNFPCNFSSSGANKDHGPPDSLSRTFIQSHGSCWMVLILHCRLPFAVWYFYCKPFH